MSGEPPSSALATFAAEISIGSVPAHVLQRAHRVLEEAATAAGWGALRQAPMTSWPSGGQVDPVRSLRGQVLVLSEAIGIGIHTRPGPCVFRPESSVVPAVAVVARVEGSSVQEILLGICAGCEVGLRIDRDLRLVAPQWSSSANAARLAAAVGVTRVLGGSSAEQLRAIGLAATQSGGISGGFTGSAGVWLAARCAADGMVAALLATCGWQGPERPLEGRRGMFQLLGGAPPPSSLVDGLGADWVMAALPDNGRPAGAVHQLIEQLFVVSGVEPTLQRKEVLGG